MNYLAINKQVPHKLFYLLHFSWSQITKPQQWLYRTCVQTLAMRPLSTASHRKPELLTLQSSSRFHFLLRPWRIPSVMLPGEGVTEVFADAAAANQDRQAAVWICLRIHERVFGGFSSGWLKVDYIQRFRLYLNVAGVLMTGSKTI